MRLMKLLTGGFPELSKLGLAVAGIGFCSVALRGVEADLPIHATIKDVKGSCEIRDVSGNAHRGSWKTLAVRNASTNEVVGGWTTVYDEGHRVGLFGDLRAGFEVMLRDKTRLMAFMKYTKNEMCPEARDGDLEDRNGRTACYETDASKTQLGWYTAIAEDGFVKSGCFFAEKKMTPSHVISPGSLVYVRQRVPEEKGDSMESTTSGFSYYLSKEFVDQHNGKLNSTWKATYNPAFIQQHHTVLSSLIKDFGFSKFNSVGGFVAMPSFLQGQQTASGTAASQLYACPCKPGEIVQDTRVEEEEADPFEVLSPLSMLQSTSTSVAVKKHQHHGSIETVAASMQETAAASGVQTSSLPKAFAWPNPFTDPSFNEQTTNQGGCGSCYAIAAVYALEKRFDIAASRLLGRVLEEGCMPYAASDELRCPSSSHEKINSASASSAAFLTTTSEAATCYAGERRWFAKDYGYVGGCYECGHCAGEENIMAEIYANGPVTAAFDAPASLFSYESGVYDTENSPHARVCDTPGTLEAPNGLNGWEFTNHAVNIVGWGETEASAGAQPRKYWIVRNTWGSKWGNQGYFLLARGKNAGGIESQVSFIDPDFSRGMGRSLLEQIKANQAAATNAV
ncbi:hypothetical protein ACSSS7_002161 [Eimeria intestinalis]